MSIIIRLQNLPLTANAEDIRRFFDNLTIPDGGVHIIGGEHGDAFIVFGSDEDARLAMMKDGGMIKTTKVKLLLSSRVEMQKIIDTAKQQAISSHNLMQTLAAASQYDPAALQMHMLPNMLSMLPNLRNLPGMPPITGIPPVPMTTLPNMTMPPTPHLVAQKAVDPKPASTTPVIQTQTVHPSMAKDKSKRDTTKGNESASRSRSRSKSRERRTQRDRYKRDRSRDRKHRRERSRSKGRDKTAKSRSRSRDRYRKRSRSKDRKTRGDPTRERDRDQNYRRRDKGGDDPKGKSPPKGKDQAAAKKLDQDSRITDAQLTNSIGKNEAAGLKLPFNQNNGLDKPTVNHNLRKNQSEVEDNHYVLPPVVAGQSAQPIANWWSGMIRPPMMPSWMPGATQPHVGVTGDPAKLVSDVNNPKNSIPPVSFGSFPFGHGFPPQNPAAMFPYGGMFPNSAIPPAMHLPPNMMLPQQDPSLLASNNGADSKADPRIARKHTVNHRNDEVEECDRFGRQRKPRSDDHDLNDDYNERPPVRKPRYDTGYETRKFTGRNQYDENSRESYGNEDNSYPRKNPYKRAYGHQDDFDSYNMDQDSSQMSDSRSSYTQHTGNCIEIRNVPTVTTDSDIKKFFSPIPVYDSCIKFIGNKENRNRNVLVKFVNSAQKDQALQKNGFNMNGVCVFIVPVPLSAWESAEKNAADVDAVSEPYLKVEFIPKRARPQDISAGFTTAAPVDVVVSKVKNRESLVAYLKFDKVEHVKTALEDKHKILICESRVKLQSIKESDFEESKHEVVDPYVPDKNPEAVVSSSNAEYSPSRRYRSDRYHYHRAESGEEKKPTSTTEATPPIKSNCVILKNLPSEVTDKEVVDFFADVDIIPAQIHIMFNADYKQSGESYCEFRTETDAETALKKNRMVLRERSISVSLVPKQTVTEAIGVPTLTPLVPYDAARSEPKTAERQSEENSTRDDNQKSSNDTEENEKIDDLKLESGDNDYEYNSQPLVANPMYPRPPFNGLPVPPEKAGWFRSRGCVVGVTNVPYRADIDHILDFFSSFGVTKEQVIRRYNDKGQATGDARVAFESPFEAQRAARMLDGQQMLERFVSVRHLP